MSNASNKISTTDLLLEVNRIKRTMPGVIYLLRAKEILGHKPGSGPCKYSLDGRPACIIGLALANLGVSIDRLKDYDDPDDFGSSIIEILEGFPEDFAVDRDSDMSELSMIQINQDRGVAWGDCSSTRSILI